MSHESSESRHCKRNCIFVITAKCDIFLSATKGVPPFTVVELLNIGCSNAQFRAIVLHSENPHISGTLAGVGTGKHMKGWWYQPVSHQMKAFHA
jgi:hypothetical protein